MIEAIISPKLIEASVQNAAKASFSLRRVWMTATRERVIERETRCMARTDDVDLYVERHTNPDACDIRVLCKEVCTVR